MAELENEIFALKNQLNMFFIFKYALNNSKQNIKLQFLFIKYNN